MCPKLKTILCNRVTVAQSDGLSFCPLLRSIHSKTSLNRPTMGPTLHRDPNKAIDILEWSNCGGGRLERFYCITLLVIVYLALGFEPWSSQNNDLANDTCRFLARDSTLLG